MLVKNLCVFLEESFPLVLQESYDNCGLLVGNDQTVINGVLIALDVTESVVDEAIKKNINVIISHHPVIFKGIKNLSNPNLTNRIIIKCIQHNISLYAIHTNLDNHHQGVNAKIAEKLNLKNTRVLAPMRGTLLKLIVYMPIHALPILDKAIFENGGGRIGNYSACHFRNLGIGTFMPNDKANPTIGKAYIREEVEEYRVEYLVLSHHKEAVAAAMISAHPYEEVAHEWYPIQNVNEEFGAGMIGTLEYEIPVEEFLHLIKTKFNCGCIKYTKPHKPYIKKVAICGGSGSFLMNDALRQQADIFISSDFKYHDFFDAEGKLIVADIGHFESEQFTSELIAEKLKEKFSTFAIQLTEINTNPINYL
jgi:dinuclear metal center YbgI/SA1388 family protein